MERGYLSVLGQSHFGSMLRQSHGWPRLVGVPQKKSGAAHRTRRKSLPHRVTRRVPIIGMLATPALHTLTRAIFSRDTYASGTASPSRGDDEYFLAFDSAQASSAAKQSAGASRDPRRARRSPHVSLRGEGAERTPRTVRVATCSYAVSDGGPRPARSAPGDRVTCGPD